MFGYGSVNSMNFPNAFRFSDQSMELTHKSAVDVNRDNEGNAVI